MNRVLVLLLGLVLSGQLLAQGSAGEFAWQDYSHRLKGSQEVSPLGPNFAGDEVSLSNGALSFRVTDVSLPGNDVLEVAFTREYQVKNRQDLATLEMLADWEVYIPCISGTFTRQSVAAGS